MLSDRRLLAAGVLAATLLVSVVPARGAQRDDRVEVEPVRCWWRSDVGDVRLGEPFLVLLTCAVLETAAARVALDESRLDPQVVQLQPFDVLDGRRAGDLVTASRRFIQFEYRLRFIGDGFGSEASVPSLQLTYRIVSRAGEAGIATADGEVVHGRDLTYTMPPLPVRITSTVPDTATDIREAPAASFQDIGRGRFRGLVLRLSAAALFAMAVLLAVSALVPAVRRRRQSAGTHAVVSDARILTSVRRELAGAREHAHQAGWAPEAIGRTLTALRIGAAYAANQPVSRVPVSASASPGEGQLIVRSRRGAALVGAAITAAALNDRPHLQPIRDALERFTVARYGRNPGAASASTRLDESLEQAIDAIDGLAGRYTWRARRSAALKRSVAEFRERLWAR